MQRTAIGAFASSLLVAASLLAGPQEGKEVWQFSTGANTGGITPAVADGRVFVTTGLPGNRIFALNADTGKRLWSKDFNDPGPWSPIVVGSQVITTTESCSIYSMDTKSGHTTWSKVISSSIYSFAAGDEKYVYAVAEDTDQSWSLVCYDARNGAAHWVSPVGTEAIGAPVIQDGVAYVATRDGVLHAIETAHGHERWRQDRGATTAPVLVEGRLLVASEEGGFHVMSLETQDGSGAWQYTGSRSNRLESDDSTRPMPPGQEVARAVGGNPCAGTSRPCVVDGAAYVGTQDGRLLCLDPKNGARKWEAVLVSAVLEDKSTIASPVVAGGRVYVGTGQGEMVCLDAAQGKQVWAAKARAGFDAAPAVTGGRVYAMSVDGVVHCIDAGTPDAEGWPMWGGDAMHTR